MSSQKTRLKSLKDLVDTKIADHFTVDSSALGTHFLTNGNSLRLDLSLARNNNLTPLEIRESLQSTEASLEFIREYSNIGATGTVLEELAKKIEFLNLVVKTYAGRKNRVSSRNQTTFPAAIRKQKKSLNEILQTEKETYRLFKDRLDREELGDDVLQFIEGIVVDAQSPNTFAKNYNDERIVSESIHRAYLNDERVAIITKDFRFKKILVATQQAVSSDENLRLIRDCLLQGKLIIIFGEKEGFYKRYCSSEFNPNHSKIRAYTPL